MGKMKYLIPMLLLVVLGCSTEPKELTDEEYFSMMSEEFKKIDTAFQIVVDALEVYVPDNDTYAQMQEPAERALAMYEAELETLESIKPVAGWEERHERLIKAVTGFQEFSREMVRTSKSGDKNDLASKGNIVTSGYAEILRLFESYNRNFPD